MSWLDPVQLKIVGQLVLAAILGAALGWEREFWHKPAGIRTHSLVALGSALFAIISISAFERFIEVTSYDPSRIVGQVVLGVGFIGAGVIIYRRGVVEGITTAAGLWMASAVGVAVGVGWYTIAILATILSFVILMGIKGAMRLLGKEEFKEEEEEEKRE